MCIRDRTLVVSFIGMKSQELDVKSNLHISLKPDTETLDEVVVVAYGAACLLYTSLKS